MSRRPAHGTLLQIGDDYGYYTTVAQVQTVTPPGYTTGTIVLADHDMTTVKEKLPEGLSEVSEMPARIYWDPADASHDELIALAQSKDIVPWKIIFPNSAGTVAFNGFVSSFQPDAAAASDGMVEADINIVATGDWTIT